MARRTVTADPTVRRGVALVPLAVIAVLYATRTIDVTGVWVYLALLGIAVLVLTVSPTGLGEFLGRLQKVSVGPVSADLQASATEAAASAATDREDDAGTRAPTLRREPRRGLTAPPYGLL